MAELSNNMTKITVTMEKYGQYDAQLEHIKSEIQMIKLDAANNKMVTAIIKWLGVVIGGSAITIIISGVLTAIKIG